MVTDAQAAQAVAGFTQAQVTKALQLIADGGVVETGFAAEFLTVSSDGHTHYLTAPDACQCRGSQRGGRIVPCYHQAAVRLYLAGKAAA